MKKEECIAKYGEAAYEKMLQQTRNWNALHREEMSIRSSEWCAANPGKVLAIQQEQSRKGGKFYEKYLEYQRTGLRAERNKIRDEHRYQYRDIRQATPNSELHDEWIPGTAMYRGVALVEKVPHQNGIIKVIKVLEGEITIFTEKEIAQQGVKT